MRITSTLILPCVTGLLLAFTAEAQKPTVEKTAGQVVRTQSFSFERAATVNFDEIKKDYAPTLLVRELPRQGAKKMEVYNYPGTDQASQKRSSLPPLAPLIKGMSFQANAFNGKTPNDNDLAISDSGEVVSVINNSIYMKNIVTGVTKPMKSLSAFTSPINSLHQEFDPKVIYDPKSDRFVLVCMVGFVDTTSKIIVGFSQTNDPGGFWNLYTLPGDALNNNLWSDYPMIAMTEKELFLSVNLLYNDSSWQTGFVETIVWQMKKRNGYAGTSLASVLHSNIKYNGKAIRNLCPVKGGSKLYGPNMYFLSNRNLASQNDTVFLVNITDTIGAPGGTLTAKALKTNQPYYFPPDGRQSSSTQSLATNDCRNLGAFYENKKIHFVHNTKNPANNLASVHYGVIHNPASTAPIVTGFILDNDTMDFAYPNISYSGFDSTDHSGVITFNHSSNKVFAGVSAIEADGFGSFSPVLRINNGNTYVDLLISNLERWGDYSGSQRRYNKPGEVWMSGYYAYSFASSIPRAHGAWVAQITTNKGFYVGAESVQQERPDLSVFPNPASETASIGIQLSQPEYMTFSLLDSQGKVIDVMMKDWVISADNTFSMNTSSLAKGLYFIEASGNKGTRTVKKLIVE